MTTAPFWDHLDRLLKEHDLVIDRPKGSVYPDDLSTNQRNTVGPI
jgi:hypothetical protein